MALQYERTGTSILYYTNSSTSVQSGHGPLMSSHVRPSFSVLVTCT